MRFCVGSFYFCLICAVLQITTAYYSPRIDWSFFSCRLQIYEDCQFNSGIVYYLWTREDRPPEVLNSSLVNLPEWYNSSLPLKVVIHGFAGGIVSDTTSHVTKAYVRAGGSNVLVVDWARLANPPCYATASINTLEVGRCLGDMLLHLPLSPAGHLNTHLVGFSLGAHIAAFASNYVQTFTGQPVGRITGLDPALPFFANIFDSWKLDKDDAIFVDAIHTNVGVFGKIEPTGDIDFYVNDGTTQPGCAENRSPPLCSHMRANLYFAESISSPVGFWGISCPSYIQYAFGWCSVINGQDLTAVSRILMGEHVVYGARGLYVVNTKSSPPYAMEL